ncbi:MAG: hypothetical protein EAZ91_04645 [Cytophagales bacterium]|nr:MAG: hypothetical protein EAZ91_04645 [Cytophagales bacterium]
MTLTHFETNLYQKLTPFFDEQQFALLPEKKQYRKTTATGFQNSILSPAFYGAETLLDVNFGCRNEQVEQIAQQFLNNLADFRIDANTLIVSIGKFRNIPYFRYKIATDEQFDVACADIQDFFVESGFALMQQASTMQGIDALLNEQPNQPSRYVYNQTHRCYKGLIAARLSHNARFDGLVDSYRHQLTKLSQNPYEQINYERLVSYLLHYSAN